MTTLSQDRYLLGVREHSALPHHDMVLHQLVLQWPS